MSDDISLREYLDEKFRLHDEATKLAADTLTARLESMNQFRAEIKDYTNRLMPKTECEAFRAVIDKEVGVLHDFKTEMNAKASQQSVLITGILAAGGLIVGIVSLFR